MSLEREATASSLYNIFRCTFPWKNNELASYHEI